MKLSNVQHWSKNFVDRGRYMENCKYLIPLITLPPMMEQKAFNEIEGEISSRYQVLVTVGKTN